MVQAMNSANPQAIREARAARTRSIRRRVIAGAVAVFLATWVWIAVVLISGHDPALASHVTTTAQVSSQSGANSSSSRAVTTGTSSSTGSTASTGSTGSTGSTASTGTTGSTGSTGSVSSVTTHQS